MQIKIKTLSCIKCNHKWTPRQNQIRLCPNCKTTYWNQINTTQKLKCLLQSIKQRCSNKHDKHYGGKNIKNFLTLSNLKALWERDKAHLLHKASLDRIDPNKDYLFENCRFIELSENCSNANFGKSKP